MTNKKAIRRFTDEGIEQFRRYLAELRQGAIQLDGKTIQAIPLSSMVRAREIATMLKDWIA